MIEVQVHQQLRAFLREQGEPQWPHHLTLARLVARALRLGRSALIQASPSPNSRSYRLSYLMPMLLWPERSILVAPEAIQHRLLSIELPRLKSWLPGAQPLPPQPIQRGDRWPGTGFNGLLLTTPEVWLADRLHNQGRFPQGIPTLIDGADNLEQWAAECLTVTLTPRHWDDLLLWCPQQADLIRDTRVQLTHSLFRHPSNPYDCYLLDDEDRAPLTQLLTQLFATLGWNLPEPWAAFYRHYQRDPRYWLQSLDQSPRLDSLLWATVARRQGQWTLHCRPIALAETLAPIWLQQPLVLLGEALDPDTEAPAYRQHLGLGELTCVRFSPDRQTGLIQLYLPGSLPLPNTPHFQAALLAELRRLLTLSATAPGFTTLLINDVPLKAQVAAILAAEFGSRVQVEQTCLEDNGILISGWDFWQQHQAVLPTPRLLVIATLPFPSLEHPLVAGRVEYHKQQRQDWFRSYLLPQCLGDLQRAIAPVRDTQGLVALLDLRVLHRSYGQQILNALSPAARLNYLDPSLFESAETV